MTSFRDAIQPVFIGHNPDADRFIGVRLASTGMGVDWVKTFMYRVVVQVWVFMLIGVGAISIALITVNFQTIRAGTAKPIRS